MRHYINKEILKACDIRGVYKENLFDDNFYYIGLAFAKILIEKNFTNCAVGRDGRLSSPTLSKFLIDGLLDGGIDVVDLGFTSTPGVYFAQTHLKTGGACMVSASHNPGKYNGCKFVIDGEIFTTKYINRIDEICLNDEFVISQKKGQLSSYDIKDEYIENLLKVIDLDCLKNSKIVWDASNGASLFMLQSLLDRLPGTHTMICDEVDGNFPNHEPDPSKEENMEDLKKATVENGADLGIAFDGDGDRLGCVTSDGTFVTGEQLLLILAKDYLLDNPGAKIMSEVKASKVLYSEIEKAGGIPVMWKVGHTMQQEKAFAENIGLAGETSGHIFYLENNGQDDGTYAAMRLLDLIYNKKKTTLKAMLDEIPPVVTKGEIRLFMKTRDRESLIIDLREKLEKDNRTFNDIDGVRVECKEGFWLIRGSNTQPQITTYFEAFSEESYKQTFNDMKSYLSNCGYDYDELLNIKEN
jgi:phosphomannomutase